MFYSTNHRLNRKLRCWITASIFWLSSCHIADAKSQYRRFISRQKTYNWNSNKNVEVQIQEIQSKTGRYYQIGGAIWKPGGTIWKPGGTIWSWVQLAPPDNLGWPGTVVPWCLFHNRQGSKLGGAGSWGLPWMFLRLPQISAGSPNMYCLTYRKPLWSLWRCNWAPWKKS